MASTLQIVVTPFWKKLLMSQCYQGKLEGPGWDSSARTLYSDQGRCDVKSWSALNYGKVKSSLIM